MEEKHILLKEIRKNEVGEEVKINEEIKYNDKNKKENPKDFFLEFLGKLINLWHISSGWQEKEKLGYIINKCNILKNWGKKRTKPKVRRKDIIKTWVEIKQKPEK